MRLGELGLGQMGQNRAVRRHTNVEMRANSNVSLSTQSYVSCCTW